jgi:hypothetical protein
MSQMNPVTGSILQTSMVQRTQTDEKTRQMRHAQDLRKNVAAQDEEGEAPVENTEELVELDPDHSNPRNPPKKEGKARKRKSEKPEDEEKPHIDMTA